MVNRSGEGPEDDRCGRPATMAPTALAVVSAPVRAGATIGRQDFLPRGQALEGVVKEVREAL